ncbi:helix-turn-helix transcriptional regulator [Dyella japonica]|uniref:WYL domain-containing protein n=1 Tax=Dyella japonica TaxID=231455 RepID=A0ABV2JPD0_9GAMM
MKNNELESVRSPRGRWGQDRRLEFIDTRLAWEGRLNRSALTDFFSISIPQASLDLAKYMDLAPANMQYDPSQKTYVAQASFKPVFAEATSDRYLAELYALTLKVLSPDLSFLGATPETDVVRHPARSVPENYLRQTLSAIREQRTLQIHYQAVSHPDPSERLISPRTLGYDGARWHIRGYCHLRRAYRDFVFARILSLSLGDPSEDPVPADEAWDQELDVIIGPHPDLSEGQRRVIALDYGMTGDQLKIPTRQALVYYLLKRLGVASSVPRPAAEQQIVLLNREALVAYVPELADPSSGTGK